MAGIDDLMEAGYNYTATSFIFLNTADVNTRESALKAIIAKGHLDTLATRVRYARHLTTGDRLEMAKFIRARVDTPEYKKIADDLISALGDKVEKEKVEKEKGHQKGKSHLTVRVTQ